jgi:2-dehydropantoate 2-reductase
VKIAVVGTGGTGGYFGGLLARAGNDVTFIARGEHLRAIRRDGLTIKSVDKGDFILKVEATDQTTDVGPVDLVLFCVKGYDNHTAIPQLLPLIGPETMVLSVQNGIDNEQQIADSIGREAMLGGVALLVAAIESPGVVVHTAAEGHITFGELAGGSSSRTERLLDVFERAEISASLHSDVKIAIWDKYIGICAFSGVTSLTRLPIGPILKCPETRDLYQSTLEEVAMLGRACNIALSADVVETWMISMHKQATNQPWASSSMHHDLKVGRRLEVKILNGTASRLGREWAIPTPINDVISAALAPYADGAPEIPLAP